MDRLHVRLVSVTIAALVAAAVVIYAWTGPRQRPATTAAPPPAAPVADTAALFERRCGGGCHTRAELAGRLAAMRSGDATSRRAELLMLLTSHGDATPEEDARLVEWLIPR